MHAPCAVAALRLALGVATDGAAAPISCARPAGDHVIATTFVCPNGFIMYKESFSEAELTRLAAIIETPAYRAAMESHTTYYLFALLTEGMEDPDDELWAITLQASWQADDCAPHLYAEYAGKALAATEDQIAATDDFRATLEFVAANLHRRLGDFAAAGEALKAMVLSEARVADAERRARYEAMREELLGFVDQEIAEQRPILAGE